MSTPVELYIYDLSQGMASQFSGLVGFQLDGKKGTKDRQAVGHPFEC